MTGRTGKEIRGQDQQLFGDRIERRHALRLLAGGLTAGIALRPAAALARNLPRPSGREVTFLNLHTGERLRAEYFQNGRYMHDAMRAIAVILRDHHNNKMHAIDPHLIDVINTVHRRVGTSQPFNVISGYRSPETNAMMHEASSGVAVHSMHIQGKAIDVRLPGVRLSALRRSALDLRAGGVGYYPEDDFVHIDTGPLRHWG